MIDFKLVITACKILSSALFFFSPFPERRAPVGLGVRSAVPMRRSATYANFLLIKESQTEHARWGPHKSLSAQPTTSMARALNAHSPTTWLMASALRMDWGASLTIQVGARYVDSALCCSMGNAEASSTA